ncbi:cytochrome c6 PetJ [Synechocystis sp. PCC 7509]|uniref:cytochrome c6 PetJ n=1 Tax=Synechocystis sp. PCC 7509 TaxID=927677 RepID=UPI0002ABB19D|nr:c-type cytochrome [Synechocystis sp. PCC 7509]
MRKLITIFISAIALIILVTTPVLAASTTETATLFTNNCAGCHINGGNIVRRGKSLKTKALKKFGMDSTDAIAQLVKNGKYAMPAYKGRLTDQQILDVSAYVLEQAEHDWK